MKSKIIVMFFFFLSASVWAKPRKVKIEKEEPIQYRFSYSTGQDTPAQMFREEDREASGSVTGKYGYVDPYGTLRVVSYEAGPEGFFAQGDIGPDEEAVKFANQLAEDDYNEKLPFLKHWNEVARRTANFNKPKKRMLFQNFSDNRLTNRRKRIESSTFKNEDNSAYLNTESIFRAPKLATLKPPSVWKNDFSFLNDPHTYVSLNQEGPNGYKYNYSY